jgi:DNA polymerase-4
MALPNECHNVEPRNWQQLPHRVCLHNPRQPVARGIRDYRAVQWTEADLVKHFGKVGSAYYWFARGIDDREVESEHIRKSLGTEVTFPEDIHEMVDVLGALDEISEELYRRAEKRKFFGKTLTLKIKYADFTLITRSRTVDYLIKTRHQIFELGKELLLSVDDIQERKIRLMGLSLRNPETEASQEERPLQLSFDFKEFDDPSSK